MTDTQVVTLILVVVLIAGALAWKNRSKIPGLRNLGGGGGGRNTKLK